MKYIAHDTETTLIGKDNIIPDLICSSFQECGDSEPVVLHWSPKTDHSNALRTLFESDYHIIYHNCAFDLAVCAKLDWDLLPAIWKALEDGRIHDTMFREMLLNLTTSGSTDTAEQFGMRLPVKNSLGELVKRYLNIDIREEKNAEDSVRLNYESVRYKPMSEWPKEFVTYAASDAKYTADVFLAQELRREQVLKDTGIDPFTKESFVASSALALIFMTAQGNALDRDRVEHVTREFLDLYNDDELVWPLVHSAFVQTLRGTVTDRMLVEEARVRWESLGAKERSRFKGKGIVIPAIPPRPYSRGAKDHVPGCDRKDCDCPPKMKQGIPERGSTINLHQYVWELSRANPAVELWVSDKCGESLRNEGIGMDHPIGRDLIEAYEQVPFFSVGGKESRLSLKVDKEWLSNFASMDPVLSLYAERHKIQKIITSYLPCLYWSDEYATACPMILEGHSDKFGGKHPADRVHAAFSPLKETGRTSSFASKRGLGSNATVTYPSWNGQQVDPRIRQCVVPEKGNVLASVDYAGLELCSAAQVSYDLLGYKGVLMRLINEGRDTHSYLGAQIAAALDPEFTSAWGISSEDPDKSLDLFKAVQGSNEECDSPVFRAIFADCYLGRKRGGRAIGWDDCTMGAYYKHFRTFGKPTGLGFWGGLGEPTFISLAKASYGIEVDMATASLLRNIWRTYIPEGQEYLNYVSKHMVDPHAEPEVVEDAEGRPRKKVFYCYDTPLGMHRAKCTFTAAANGCALQSPSAEGALGAVIELMRECTVGSLKGYVFPSLFIHDEILFEVVEDSRLTSRVEAVCSIMERNMEKITPDVKSRTEPAVMRRWDKFAEEKRNSNGELIPWEDE